MVSQKVNILVDQETAPIHSVVASLLKFAEKLGNLGVLNAYVANASSQKPQTTLEKAGFKIVSVPPGKNSIGFRIIQDCMKLSTQTLSEVYVLVLQEGDYTETIRLLKARNKGVILFTQRIVSENYRWLKLADYHYFLEDLAPKVTRSTQATKTAPATPTPAKSAQVKSAQVKSAQAKSAQVKSAQVKSAQAKSTPAKSTPVQSAQPQATSATPAQVKPADQETSIQPRSTQSQTPAKSTQSKPTETRLAQTPSAKPQQIVRALSTRSQPSSPPASAAQPAPSTPAKPAAQPKQPASTSSPSKLRRFLAGDDLSASVAQSTKSVRLPKFRNAQLLEQALTHRSYANEMDHDEEHNERLEFLGDCVLNFLCGEFLYQYFPDKTEGELTALRSALVNEKQLTEFAEQLKLGPQLRLGKGAEQDGSRTRPSILSSTFEALVGAYFIDSGSQIDAVRQFVLPLFESITDRMDTVAPPVNHKSELQHWAMVNRGENPVYTVIAAVGPDHSKEFTVEVSVLGKLYGQGTGRRKQDAEKDAARDALESLGLI